MLSRLATADVPVSAFVLVASQVSLVRAKNIVPIVRQRVQHVKKKGKVEKLKVARQGSVAASRAIGNIDEDHWLCPMEDRRKSGSNREGMLEGFCVSSYLLLLDYSSRLVRNGKANVSSSVAEIFDRLGTSSDLWFHRLDRLLNQNRLLGNFFATDRDRLKEIATTRGCHHIDNLNACKA